MCVSTLCVHTRSCTHFLISDEYLQFSPWSTPLQGLEHGRLLLQHQPHITLSHGLFANRLVLHANVILFFLQTNTRKANQIVFNFAFHKCRWNNSQFTSEGPESKLLVRTEGGCARDQHQQCHPTSPSQLYLAHAMIIIFMPGYEVML